MISQNVISTCENIFGTCQNLFYRYVKLTFELVKMQFGTCQNVISISENYIYLSFHWIVFGYISSCCSRDTNYCPAQYQPGSNSASALKTASSWWKCEFGPLHASRAELH